MRSFFLLSLLGLVAANNNTTETTTTTAAASNVTTTTAAATTTTTAAATTTTVAATKTNATAWSTSVPKNTVEATFSGWKANKTCAEIQADENMVGEINDQIVAADSAKFGSAKLTGCTDSRRLAAGRNLAEKTLSLTVRIYAASGVSAADLKTAADGKVAAIQTKIAAAFTAAGFTVDASGVTAPASFTAKALTPKTTGTVTFKFFSDKKCATADTTTNGADVSLTVGAGTCTKMPFISANAHMQAKAYYDDAAGDIQLGEGATSSLCETENVLGIGQCREVGSGSMKAMVGGAGGGASSTSGAVSTGLGAAAALSAAVLMF